MQLNARHEAATSARSGDDWVGSVREPPGRALHHANSGACAAGDASCPVFKKTGEAFQLNIAGVAWQADDDEDLCSGNLATPTSRWPILRWAASWWPQTRGRGGGRYGQL